MSEETAFYVINNFLNGLEATGESGFEGLVSVLIQEATSQEYRLASAGRQSGRDAGSEPGSAIIVKVETKHYRETTALRPRELIAEVHEAAESDPALDIWILAASRHVSEQIAIALDREAESCGIDVLVLDLGINGLPRLGVLMAAFATFVRAWADRHQLQYDVGKLNSALLAIASEPDFESTKLRLLAKLDGMIGYEGARRRICDQILKAVSEPNRARAAFHQSLDVRVSGVDVIRRNQLHDSLEAWWDAPSTPRPLVAVGEEGTGKTWAVFDWALGRLERGVMPILLPLAAVAHQISNGDSVEIILSRLLARWSGELHDEQWSRRLTRWVQAGSTGKPIILLIVDGLNERADVQWRPFLTALMADPWRSSVAVIVTDRPHHWRTKCAMAGVSLFGEIEVGGYSSNELDHVLAASGLSHSDIPVGLLPLISIPRYCRLVANHWKEMIASADFTPERLIYLEVKDRQTAKLGYPLTDADVFGLMRDLAQRARINPELDRNDLMPSIGNIPGGPSANIYEEIVSSGLLIPASANGMTEGYKVAPLRLIYGFGMLLADELRKQALSGASDLEEFITSWFEPQPDMERKGDICASAMFHALFHQDFPEPALRELIRYWLGVRNWGSAPHLDFAAYVLRSPKVFLDLAEDFWSAPQDSGAAQEFFGAALTAHRDDARLQPLLTRAIERWMGFVHPLGRNYMRLDAERIQRSRQVLENVTGQPVLAHPSEHEGASRVAREIEARAGCSVVPGEIEVSGTRLTVVPDGAILRLARLGLMVMSAGDVSPFVGSLTNWAVASAVMDDSGFSDLAAWVIRLSKNQVDSAVLTSAKRLLARGEATASAAARTLLLAVGNVEAESLIKEHNLVSDWYIEQRKQHLADPCLSHYEWTESECLACLDRADVPMHAVLKRGEIPIVDPSVSPPHIWIPKAKEALKQIDPEKIRSGGYRTEESYRLEMLSQILCAHAPLAIANFLRIVVKTMQSRNLTGQYYLAVEMPKLSLLLSRCEVNSVVGSLAVLSANASAWHVEMHDGTRQKEQIAEARAFLAVVPYLGPSELFDTLIARPVNALDLVELEPWFAPISESEGHVATDLLHAPPDKSTLHRVLWMLPHLGVTLTERDRARLADLAVSEDSRDAAGAIRVAVVGGDELLGRRLVDLGIVAATGVDSWAERWVTLLLARFGVHLPFDVLAKRLRPSAIGFAISQRGSRRDELEMYADCLDHEWRQIVEAEDPEVEFLPEITVRSCPKDTGSQFPQLHEPNSSRTVHLDRLSSWTSGPPRDPAQELKKLFSQDNEAEVKELNEDRRRKTDAILAAWGTAAFQWYGRMFSLEAIDKLYQQNAERMHRWVQPALADSPAGLAARVRLGGFLEPACRTLLERKPELGMSLWRALRKRDNNPISFDVVDIAFCTDSSGAKLARKELLDECWSDASIARIALACGKWKREGWLQETIQGLISGERLWKRTMGLALASFSDIGADQFEELVAQAEVEHTWAEKGLRSLRVNIRKNNLARHWFRVFLASPDADVAWGALQIVLAHTDERFLNWHEDVVNECADKTLVESRLRFLNLGWHSRKDLRKEINRDNERRDHFLGQKIHPGEIFPFMSSSG
jgi:hypothetical protein